MRIWIVAASLAAITIPGATSAAGDLPYGPTLTFAASRDGQLIGRHSLRFVRRGSELTVSISVEFAAKVFGFMPYRYSHHSTEMWNGGEFLSLSSQTDDNGKGYKVNIKRHAAVLEVERFAEPEVTPASAAFDGFKPPGTFDRIAAPAETLPSTQWNVRQVDQRALLNTQYGTVAHVQILSLGRETIRTATGSLQASHYRYSGDIRMDQWFDERGRWVKGMFVASDGSVIDYVLQE